MGGGLAREGNCIYKLRECVQSHMNLLGFSKGGDMGDIHLPQGVRGEAEGIHSLMLEGSQWGQRGSGGA